MNIISRCLAVSFAVSLLLLLPRPGVAGIEMGASPNPVGSGARAMGMGGAFIGVADDATAASWNPAGLVQLERPEISAVGMYHNRMEDVRAHVHPELDGMNRTETVDLNFLSLVYPFTLFSRNITLSLNHQRLYDMNKDFSGMDNIHIINGILELTNLSDTRFEQRGGMTTVSPAMAFQVTPDLSFGFTYNFWVNPFGDNGWVSYSQSWQERTILIIPLNIVSTNESVWTRTNDFDFYGTNFVAGVMYNVTPDLTVGGVYKDGFKARLRRTRHASDWLWDPQDTSDTDFLVLTMPCSYGVGLSYRYSDALTFALDVYRTEWSQYVVNDDGEQTRPNIDKPQNSRGINEGQFEHRSYEKATTQVRGGLEYLVIEPTYVIPLRIGGFYDPDPSENHPNDFFGFSLGTGIAIDPFAFDVAYIYRTGKSAELLLGATAADSYLEQHQVMFSLIYYLDWPGTGD